METRRKRNRTYAFPAGAALAAAAAFFACAFLASLFFTTRIGIDFAGQNDERVLIVVNFNIDDAVIALPETAGTYTELAGDVEIWGQASFADGTLTLPAYGIAVLK